MNGYLHLPSMSTSPRLGVMRLVSSHPAGHQWARPIACAIRSICNVSESGPFSSFATYRHSFEPSGICSGTMTVCSWATAGAANKQAATISPRIKHPSLVVGRLIVLALAALVLCATSGCATPDTVSLEHMHVSHPLLGPPFGPSNEEDTLDTLGLRAAWHRDRYYMELSLGQQLADSGFYGDGFIFTSRVGVTLWGQQ